MGIKAKSLKYFTASYILMFLVLFILPSFSHEHYSILKNTTSHLGAQNTPNSWVMNLTFILLGVTSAWTGWRFLQNFWFQKIALLFFGTALVMTAFFQHAPIDSSLIYDVREDQLHSLFANITGWFFSIFAFSLGFVTTVKPHRILAFFMAVLAPVLSVLMFYGPTEQWMGVWQRLIFIAMFGWMIYVFENYTLHHHDSKSEAQKNS